MPSGAGGRAPATDCGPPADEQEARSDRHGWRASLLGVRGTAPAPTRYAAAVCRRGRSESVGLANGVRVSAEGVALQAVLRLTPDV